MQSSVSTYPTIFDTFTRTTSAGEWGTTDSSHDWRSEDSYASVTGTAGQIVVPADASAKSYLIDLSEEGIPDQGSAEALALLQWSATAAYPNTNFGLALRRTSANTYYFCAIHDNYNEVSIGVYISGTRYELNRTAKTISKDMKYWVRYKVSNGGCFFKIWELGTTEPSSWTLQSGLFDGSNPPGAGDVGIYYRGTDTAYTISIDAIYYYTLEDTQAPMPVLDTFERNVDTGFGYSDSSHLWEGNISLDPRVSSYHSQGSVIDDTDGYGQWIIGSDVNQYGFLGPPISGNVETYMVFSINSSAGNTYFRPGVRGTLNLTTGATRATGYAVYVATGATTIQLQKKTSVSGSWTNIGSASSPFTALTANTKYHVRLQLWGTTVRAKLWQDGSGEPGSWMVSTTDSSISTSGRMFFEYDQADGITTQRTLKLFRAEYVVPTVDATPTTTGSLSLQSATDTSLVVRAAFTNDSDTDNSVSVRYRVSGTVDWLTANVSPSRSSTYFDITISSLVANTSYVVEVTYIDPDGVTGTNPRTTTVSTTAKGITTGTISVQSVDATTATIWASYTDDTDNDSTATIESRITSQLEQLVLDTFTNTQNKHLADHSPDLGGTWIKYAGSDVQAHIYNNRLYADFTANEQLSAYYNATVADTAEYELLADVRMNDFSASVGLAARFNNSTGYCYLVRFVNNAWELVLRQATDTVLDSYSEEIESADTIKQIQFIVKDDVKSLLVDGVEVCRSTDNTLTSANYAAVVFESLTNTFSVANAPTIDNVIVQQRVTENTFSSDGSMTADRGNKRFTKDYTSLTSDAVYEFRVTYADSDGIRGFNPQIVTAMTTGQAVAFSHVAIESQFTSAIVNAYYLYDTNNNSALTAQFRSDNETLWTTIPDERIIIDRNNKVFKVILSPLRPGRSYAYRITFSDPNGIYEGSVSTIENTFVTPTNVIFEGETQKSYLWKVYDSEGNYLETWHDAGIPRFSAYENGGVSDLSVTLPRRTADVKSGRGSIAHQNEVKVWALDMQSDGLGINLINDEDFDVGSWTLGANAAISEDGGPDGSNALKIETAVTTVNETLGESVELRSPSPLVLTSVAKARGGKLQMYLQAYNSDGTIIDTSDERAETVGSNWQKLKLEYIPRPETYTVRVVFANSGSGTMYADKVQLRPKELLVYQGRIDTFVTEISEAGENVKVEILGLASLLTDDYIDFLQFVAVQPSKDALEGKPYQGPTDPANMIHEIIARARQQNPRCTLYTTASSVKPTGNIAEYTFRDQPLNSCFDRVRTLAPPNWHFFIEPDGLVVFRGPEHVKTHMLRIGVEILNFSVERSIRNLKNFIEVRGRQDSDASEPDGFGNILEIAFDQASIDQYGRRKTIIRDASIQTPDTALIVAEGRLEEFNREEVSGRAIIPDINSLLNPNIALRGYNIESFKPGDVIIVVDPIDGTQFSYWNAMYYNQDPWDVSMDITVLPEEVPIKTVQYEGDLTRLETSARPPSGVGKYGQLYKWLQLQERQKSDPDA